MHPPVTPSTTLGCWDRHHGQLTEPARYGDSASYQMAADFLSDCETIEDWGCGAGGFRSFIAPERYTGVDGSQSPFADVIDDLALRDTRCEGIMLRHVLEHNENWADILANAQRCATRKIFIAIHTPLADKTQVIARHPAFGNVPDISFQLGDLLARVRPPWNRPPVTMTIDSPQTVRGVETIMMLEWR